MTSEELRIMWENEKRFLEGLSEDEMERLASDADNEELSVPELDFTEFESPSELAKAVKDHLEEWFATEVFIRELREDGTGYEVVCEGGVYRWAVEMLGYSEMFGMSGYHDHPVLDFEATNSFSLGIFKNQEWTLQEVPE